MAMHLEEEDSAKKRIGTERGVLAELKNILDGDQIHGDAESSGSAVADHVEDADGIECMDNRCATRAHGIKVSKEYLNKVEKRYQHGRNANTDILEVTATTDGELIDQHG